MPELPEVETVRQGLEEALLGLNIRYVEKRRSDLRFPIPENLNKQLQGRTISSLRRRAKYLLIDLDNGWTLLSHLGMSGRWTILRDDLITRPGRFAHGGEIGSGQGPHDWIIINFENGYTAVYSDPRRFGFIDLIEPGFEDDHPMLAKLGPDPLPSTLTPDILNRSLIGRKTPLKSALLDQRIVAGLGNIYVCEALSRACLSPRRRAGTISSIKGPTERIHRLVSSIHQVMVEAIDAGGSTLRDYRGVDGDNALGYFPLSFQVYGREGEKCLNRDCKGTVSRYIQSGRSTYACSSCQR